MFRYFLLMALVTFLHAAQEALDDAGMQICRGLFAYDVGQQATVIQERSWGDVLPCLYLHPVTLLDFSCCSERVVLRNGARLGEALYWTEKEQESVIHPVIISMPNNENQSNFCLMFSSYPVCAIISQYKKYCKKGSLVL